MRSSGLPERDLRDDLSADVLVHPLAPVVALELELVAPRRRADLDVQHALPHPDLFGDRRDGRADELGPRLYHACGVQAVPEAVLLHQIGEHIPDALRTVGGHGRRGTNVREDEA